MHCELKKWLGYVGVILFTLHCSLFAVSCSEDEGEPAEFDNWQYRNDAAVVEWAANGSYRKIRTYTQDEATDGANSDFIYVEVLETGAGKASPLQTDTARVAYRGRLIPSKTYAEGYVFDESYLGDFNWKTIGTVSGASWIEGFQTALLNMHVGDRWRVYIPYSLAYGSASTTTRPAYSNLIFDIALVDFWHPGETRPDFKGRER